MPIESFIEEPDGSQHAYRQFDVAGEGHLYTSYPGGDGGFEAVFIHYTGGDTANVIEVEDGSSIALSFDPTYLPEGVTVTPVDAKTPYERVIVSSIGLEGILRVRSVSERALAPSP